MFSSFILDWIQISVLTVAATGIKLPLYKSLFYKNWPSTTRHFIYSAVFILIPCILIPTIFWLRTSGNTTSVEQNDVFKALFSFFLLVEGFLIDVNLVRRREPDFAIQDLWKKPKAIIYTLATNFLITLTLLGIMFFSRFH